jgi:photosystem II stability/assembly factor-like uncharacterized protein
MKKTLHTLMFLLILTPICLAQWVVYQPLTDLNQNDVYYTGADRITIVCDKGLVLQTKNSGVSWSQLQLTDDSNLNSIFFVDDNFGFIAGDRGRIFRTEDCWDNWIDVSIDFNFHINDISFFDYDNGFVIGSKEVRIDGRTYFLPTIHITTDAGLNWSEKHFDLLGKLNSVVYLDEGIVLAVGDCGLVFRSTDYGNTWNFESINVLTNLNEIKMRSDYVTIIAGDDGTCLYSFDLGESWQLIDVPYYYHIKGTNYNLSGEIIAACSKEVRIDGRTFFMATLLNIDLISNRWTEEFSQIRGKYNSVSFCEPNLSIVVGDSGLIAGYDSPSFVSNDNGELIIDFHLVQNYPNPFNPTTKLSWQSPISGWKSLKVYDVLGNEVATLVDEYKPAGSYEIDFDASQLSSGIYFYRLQSGNFVETKKMIFLK